MVAYRAGLQLRWNPSWPLKARMLGCLHRMIGWRARRGRQRLGGESNTSLRGWGYPFLALTDYPPPLHLFHVVSPRGRAPPQCKSPQKAAEAQSGAGPRDAKVTRHRICHSRMSLPHTRARTHTHNLRGHRFFFISAYLCHAMFMNVPQTYKRFPVLHLGVCRRASAHEWAPLCCVYGGLPHSGVPLDSLGKSGKGDRKAMTECRLLFAEAAVYACPVEPTNTNTEAYLRAVLWALRTAKFAVQARPALH
jgi:hypothetical protein